MKAALLGGRLDGEVRELPDEKPPAVIQVPVYADAQWRELQAGGGLRGDDPFATVGYRRSERTLENGCVIYVYDPKGPLP